MEAWDQVDPRVRLTARAFPGLLWPLEEVSRDLLVHKGMGFLLVQIPAWQGLVEDQAAKCQVLVWSHLPDQQPTQQPIYQVVIQSQTYHNNSSNSSSNISSNNNNNSSSNSSSSNNSRNSRHSSSTNNHNSRGRAIPRELQAWGCRHQANQACQAPLAAAHPCTAHPFPNQVLRCPLHRTPLRQVRSRQPITPVHLLCHPQPQQEPRAKQDLLHQPLETLQLLDSLLPQA